MFTALFITCIISVIMVTLMVAKPINPVPIDNSRIVYHHLTETDPLPVRPSRNVYPNWNKLYSSADGMYTRKERVNVAALTGEGVVIHWGNYRGYGDTEPGRPTEVHTLGL